MSTRNLGRLVYRTKTLRFQSITVSPQRGDSTRPLVSQLPEHGLSISTAWAVNGQALFAAYQSQDVWE
ncbi:hypothetical protein VUN82_09730 [Micrococcaceae bacterium Sec5.1]